MLLNRTPQLWIKINIRSRTIVLDSSALNRFFFIRLIIQWVGETALVISLGVDSSISCYLCHLLHHHPEHELNTCCGQHQGQVRITLSVTKQHSPCFRFPVPNCYFRKLLLGRSSGWWILIQQNTILTPWLNSDGWLATPSHLFICLSLLLSAFNQEIYIWHSANIFMSWIQFLTRKDWKTGSRSKYLQ